METGICPKCKEVKELTNHHIYPKRFYGNQFSRRKLLICRTCHNTLETFIPQREKMPDKFYQSIVDLFLATNHPTNTPKIIPSFW